VTLGILGGGQLARMLAIAAAPLGIKVRSYDPSADACAGDVCELRVGDYDDNLRLTDFANGLDVVTYEFENVPTEAVKFLEPHAPVRPGKMSLATSQDRALEKPMLEQAGFELAPWRRIDSLQQLREAIALVGTPAILKTRRGGYDGKGQAIIAHADDADRAWVSIEGSPAVLESMLAFDRELSLVAVRGLDGAMAAYPLVENEHRQGILRVTSAPASGIEPSLQAAAESMAATLLESLNHIGVLTIEFFETNGALVANEFAPRVHNSGHWTIDGAATSQFENHVRAVLGLPLGPTTVRTPTVMLNCVGAMPEPTTVLADACAKLHDYCKPPRPGRKVGHVNVLGLEQGRIYEIAERMDIDLG